MRRSLAPVLLLCAGCRQVDPAPTELEDLVHFFFVDFDSEEDGKATVRERDAMRQERIPLEGVGDYVAERIGFPS